MAFGFGVTLQDLATISGGTTTFSVDTAELTADMKQL